MFPPIRPHLGISPYGTLLLDALQRGAPFLHGALRHLHMIGPYVVVAYHPLLPDALPSGERIDRAVLLHYGYVDGHPSGQSWLSLDAALAACIAHRHQGEGHFADTIFTAMLRHR